MHCGQAFDEMMKRGVEKKQWPEAQAVWAIFRVTVYLISQGQAG